MEDELREKLTELITDVKWIKKEIGEIKNSINQNTKKLNDLEGRVDRLEPVVSFNSKVMWGLVGALIGGFISIVFWIIRSL